MQSFEDIPTAPAIDQYDDLIEWLRNEAKRMEKLAGTGADHYAQRISVQAGMNLGCAAALIEEFTGGGRDNERVELVQLSRHKAARTNH